jgi:hypothetical protein
LTNKGDDLPGSTLIDAGNNSCGVGKLVLFEQTIETLLKDLFIGESLSEQNDGENNQ